LDIDLFELPQPPNLHQTGSVNHRIYPLDRLFERAHVLDRTDSKFDSMKRFEKPFVAGGADQRAHLKTAARGLLTNVRPQKAGGTGDQNPYLLRGGCVRRRMHRSCLTANPMLPCIPRNRSGSLTFRSQSP